MPVRMLPVWVVTHHLQRQPPGVAGAGSGGSSPHRCPAPPRTDAYEPSVGGAVGKSSRHRAAAGDQSSPASTSAVAREQNEGMLHIPKEEEPE